MSSDERLSVPRVVRDALDGRGHIVLAVSGGLDSTVLLHAASQAVARERLVVATFDHGTGQAATEAARAVKRRAAELDLEFVGGRAKATLSSEAELRAARWNFLRSTASRRGASVATAHTESDQIETVLMRVMRGAGARGLAGLYAASDIARPLLGITRADVSEYAREHALSWVEDPTNASREYFRNRVRHDLLPALRAVRPMIDADLLALSSSAAVLRDEVEAFVAVQLGLTLCGGQWLDVPVDALADRADEELALLWPAIAARVGATLDRRGTERLTAFTREARVGARMQLAGGWQVVRSRDALQLRASAVVGPAIGSLSRSGLVEWGGWSFRPVDGPPGGDAMSAWLPEQGSLTIRAWRPGDTMVAREGGPARKVKHLLSRAGITGHDRAAWPVVLAGDRIVWIPGVRRADAATARSGRPGLAFACEFHRR